MKKVVVITGASSGIGKVCANYLYDKGYKVYGLNRTPIISEKIEYIKCDVTNEEDVKNAFLNIEEDIYAVINNAGMGISGAIEYATSEDVSRIIDVNIKGVINVCKYAIPRLRATKGKIINIGSVAGELTIPFQTFYSMSKVAVSTYTEGLRMELKPFGIKATTVLPGDTKSSFSKNRKKTEVVDELYKDRIERSISRMEKDEQSGKDPISVAKVIYKLLKRKNPPVKVTVGFIYKLFVFLKRILPSRLVNYILYKMYGE
ncbi:MAG: SDR family NAD(P)-dependent oxidoreductase [Bacilli bacterium]|nr:SDR family NAD(P)-dependent oxidoreductase [Bacilli bacterium]